MKIYARVLAGTVAELFQTNMDITTLFNPTIQWVDVTTVTPAVQVGWLQQANGTFVVPPASPVPNGAAVAPATLAGVQAALAALQAQVNTLAGGH